MTIAHKYYSLDGKVCVACGLEEDHRIHDLEEALAREIAVASSLKALATATMAGVYASINDTGIALNLLKDAAYYEDTGWNHE